MHIQDYIGQARIVDHTDDWTDEDYSAYRHDATAGGCIGGSDAGAVLGIDPYRSKMELYLQLTGQLQPSDVENERMWCGRMLQDALQGMFEQRSHRSTVSLNVILQHPDYDWMIATPDAFILPCNTDGIGILELKNTGTFMAHNWKDGAIADSAYAQLLHYLMVTGHRYGYVAALIGGNRFEVRRVDRDENLIDKLLAWELAFHDAVVHGQMPEWTAADAEVVSQLYPAGSARPGLVDLPSDLISLVDDYEQGHLLEKEGKRMKETAQVKLQAALGESTAGTIGGLAEVYWEPQTRKSYVVPEKTFRRFRVKRA